MFTAEADANGHDDKSADLCRFLWLSVESFEKYDDSIERASQICSDKNNSVI